jgi:NADH-quinone oxidoreductase subunit J
MSSIQVIFYLFAAMAVFSAVMVVSAKNSMHGILFLVLTFVATAGIWLLLNAEFLALILVLVYVGAVMTLFLFVIMMLRVEVEAQGPNFVRYLPIGLLLMVSIVGLILMVVGPTHFGLAMFTAPAQASSDYNNVADLGISLYTDYAYPFEIAAVLLLTAIIAAISLTHRSTTAKKIQNVNNQINVRAEDRVKLIKMPPEKNN